MNTDKIGTQTWYIHQCTSVSNITPTGDIKGERT